MGAHLETPHHPVTGNCVRRRDICVIFGSDARKLGQPIVRGRKPALSEPVDPRSRHHRLSNAVDHRGAVFGDYQRLMLRQSLCAGRFRCCDQSASRSKVTSHDTLL
jgi:hypothetical protein